MVLPSTRLPVVPASCNHTPAPRLPLIRLPAPGVSPPITLLLAPSPMNTPSERLPAALVPVASVPMTLPRTWLPVVPASHNRTPNLRLLLIRFSSMIALLAPPSSTIPSCGKLRTRNPRIVIPSAPLTTRPESVDDKPLPSRTTPALLASIVKASVVIPGSLLWREIVTGAVGGKTARAKVMMSPDCASRRAWRSVPGPLSPAPVTTMVCVLTRGGAPLRPARTPGIHSSPANNSTTRLRTRRLILHLRNCWNAHPVTIGR